MAAVGKVSAELDRVVAGEALAAGRVRSAWDGTKGYMAGRLHLVYDGSPRRPRRPPSRRRPRWRHRQRVVARAGEVAVGVAHSALRMLREADLDDVVPVGVPAEGHRTDLRLGARSNVRSFTLTTTAIGWPLCTVSMTPAGAAAGVVDAAGALVVWPPAAPAWSVRRSAWAVVRRSSSGRPAWRAGQRAVRGRRNELGHRGGGELDPVGALSCGGQDPPIGGVALGGHHAGRHHARSQQAALLRPPSPPVPARPDRRGGVGASARALEPEDDCDGGHDPHDAEDDRQVEPVVAG
jgi:hypothetical protein